jgi:diacylglycerol O-acyltransferase / wax synthase
MDPHRGGFPRLTNADRMNLLVERPDAPLHFSLLGILDGGPLTREGRLLVEPVRAALGRALVRAPRLGQVVRSTLPGQGPPAWVDSASMDLDRHLRVVPVADPGDEQALLLAAEAVVTPPMDRSHPLWDLTLLPGVADGKVGLVLRLHHAVADGVAAVRLLGDIFDGLPGGDGPPGQPVRPVRPPPTGLQLAADAWRRRLAGLRRISDVHAMATSSRALATQFATLARTRGPGPRTSLNRPVGPRRRIAVLRLPLLPLWEVAHEYGGTVNDAILAAVAGAVRAVLISRGERADLTLRASVPVSLAGTDAYLGNKVGVMLAPLPLAERDPRRRLARIAAATREEKVRARRAGALAFMTTPLAARLALPLMRRQRLVNLFVTNVPGPRRQLWLAGAELLEAYPVAGLAGNVTLGVDVLSYAGDLGLSLVTDADAWPDLPVLVDALGDSFDALLGMVGPRGMSTATSGRRAGPSPGRPVHPQ